MIRIEVPGRGTLELEHLVPDLNGTLAVDGIVSEPVAPIGTKGGATILMIYDPIGY